ncbi:MAG: alpha-glucosidase [bacterium ADurb.Bin429]|nr:MAG: alpha-glucosidase [bacterium ADurb.Bin429]
MLAVDITKTPFSRYGSYLSVCAEDGNPALTIHNCLKLFNDKIFALTFRRDGTVVSPTLSATPWCLNVFTEGGRATIYLRDDNKLIMVSDGLDCTLELVTKFGFGGQQTPRRFRMLASSVGLYVGIDIPAGKAHLYGPMEERPGPIVRSRDCILHLQAEDGRAELVLEIDPVEPYPHRPLIVPDPEVEIAAIRTEWEAYRAPLPAIPAGREDGAELALYTLWSATVRNGGNYAYDAVIMAKKFMCAVWAWDHCFNAMALTYVHPRAGLEQFLLPFEFQALSGQVPDCFGRDGALPFGGTKPPIHGWCFSQMMDIHPWDHATLRKVYDHLERWTDWWFTYRDLDNNGLPDYPIALDSGWDNSSLLEHAFHLESADLASFLVLQMHALARIARALNDENAVRQWEMKARELLDRMIATLWTGEYFTARRSGGDLIRQEPTSMLSVMPLVLGDLLPREIYTKLVKQLRTRYLTEHGPATEAYAGPLYESDGYWTGPIWAPSTYLLVDGLRRGGDGELADDIARRFCDMIQHIAGGNYENFDALTGKGLRAPGYSWTAAVNLQMIIEMAKP